MQAAIATAPRFLLAERLLLAAVIFAILVRAQSFVVLNAYLALGQAHFVMTYLSQWRAGRYTKKGLALYLFVAVLGLLGLAVNQACFVFVVSVFFVAHNVLDDLRLLGERLGRAAAFAALPHALVVLGLASDALLMTHLSGVAAAAAIGVYAVFLIHAGRHGLWRQAYILYMLCITPLIFLFYLDALGDALAVPTAAVRVFGFIILVHYSNWYAYIYRRLKARAPQYLNQYLREIAVVNALCIGGLLLCFWANNKGILAFDRNLLYTAVYWPPMVYFWTLMHMAVSWRPEDMARQNR